MDSLNLTKLNNTSLIIQTLEDTINSHIHLVILILITIMIHSYIQTLMNLRCQNQFVR